MKLTLADVLARLTQAGQGIEQVFEAEDNRARQASGLSQLLRKVLPGAAVHACILGDEDSLAGSVRDEKGVERPEWLEVDWQSFGFTQPLVPPSWRLPGMHLIWENSALKSASQGGVGVVVPDDLAPGQRTAIRGVLQILAAQLRACRDAAAGRRDRLAMREELAVNRGLADQGEVAAPLAHEFNNFLNALLLHVAVLELKLPKDHRQGLADLRQQGKSMAAVVQQWQCYRRRPVADRCALDLNLHLRDVVQALSGDGVLVRLELLPEPVPLPAAAADLQRLFSFLLRNAAAVTPVHEAIILRSGQGKDGPSVQINDGGPTLDPECLDEFFNLNPGRRDGRNSLELAACKTIVRRLQGKIAVENGPERGVVVTVHFGAT